MEAVPHEADVRDGLKTEAIINEGSTSHSMTGASCGIIMEITARED